MANTRFSELFVRYLQGTASAEEAQEMKAMLRTSEYDAELRSLLKAEWEHFPGSADFFSEDERQRMLDHILEPVVERHVLPTIWLRRIAAVAAVLLLVAGGFYFFGKNEKVATITVAKVADDIGPGHAGAIVTLSDGRRIALDTAKDGLLAMDGNVRIIKANGQIRYEGIATEVAYNETSTDRGRSWPVELPDGSTVWLNTSSSIRYPLSFTGKERRVQMTGECYFEVVHNDKMPFRVELPGGEVVEDVGTAFNIRAYKDEAIARTTVTEGVANISLGAVKLIITEGRQAESGKAGLQRVIAAANMDEIIAWKDNRFRFRNASVQQILAEAARWYDMELQYKDAVTDTYTISMSRAVPLSKLLNDMELSGGVHFKIEGNKVTVTR